MKVICENTGIITWRRVISTFNLGNFTYITDNTFFSYIHRFFSLSLWYSSTLYWVTLWAYLENKYLCLPQYISRINSTLCGVIDCVLYIFGLHLEHLAQIQSKFSINMNNQNIKFRNHLFLYQTLNQGWASYGPLASPGQLPVFVHKVLLSCNIYLYCIRLFADHNARVE